MTQGPALNEVTLARQCLQHLSEERSVLHRVAHVLELVAHSSVGLGEVLQDFARQSCAQVRDLIRAAHNAANGIQYAEDIDLLSNAHLIMKTAKTVLEMTPAAMGRNKADTIGEKEKLSRAEIAKVADAFLHSPDVARLLASENSGQTLAALLAPADGQAIVAPEHASVFLEGSARH